MGKYQFEKRVELKDREWPNKRITTPPRWCSVDLRDGNQAIPVPMDLHEKKELFELLVKMGFKEIEVGFPAASQIDFDFLRELIESDMVPEDVNLQVLTQAREHIIRRTFEALKGAHKAVIHMYNSTSVVQREITFNKSKEEIKQIAIEGTKLVKSLIPELPGTHITLQYSPESFSGTETDYALNVCNEVRKVWTSGGTPENVDRRIIFNLPATVEESTPNVFADQIEWFAKNIGDRKNVILSIHTHNDRGTAVAATELGLLAGADRVEGTLFGNGERTGNVDLINIALNMYSEGIEPGLNVYDIPAIQEVYERTTTMKVPPRHPYAGELVFTAFSGSHQDAIKKGLDAMKKAPDTSAPWKVPYLLIDPKDIGRDYEAIIRINSQSGKGGVTYILQTKYGYEMPKAMQPDVGKLINEKSDEIGKELDASEILNYFRDTFVNKEEPLALRTYSISTHEEGSEEITCTAEVVYEGVHHSIKGTGNGPISAFVNAMKAEGWNNFDVIDFHEQSLGTGSGTEAAAYVGLKTSDETKFWGIGQHTDITAAGLKALISAYNRSIRS